MDLTDLKNRIVSEFSGSGEDLNAVLSMVDEDQAIFPFNEYEHLICNLINKGGLTYDQYMEIRTEYISENPNLWIFEMSAPRGFGEKFAQTYVQGKCCKLKKPSKKIDPGNIIFLKKESDINNPDTLSYVFNKSNKYINPKFKEKPIDGISQH